jgi:hypothetical protein
MTLAMSGLGLIDRLAITLRLCWRELHLKTNAGSFSFPQQMEGNLLNAHATSSLNDKRGSLAPGKSLRDRGWNDLSRCECLRLHTYITPSNVSDSVDTFVSSVKGPLAPWGFYLNRSPK